MAKSEMIQAYEFYFGLPWGESDFEQAHWEASWKAARAVGLVERDRLQAEVHTLRRIISECATACGAAISANCTVEFMQHLPQEIELVISKLRKGGAQ